MAPQVLSMGNQNKIGILKILCYLIYDTIFYAECNQYKTYNNAEALGLLRAQVLTRVQNLVASSAIHRIL